MRYWDKSWSIVSGCTPVSPACEHCWLAAMEYRFDKCPGLLRIQNGQRLPCFSGNIILRSDRLDIPLKIKKPTTFAIWSDLFHPLVPSEFIHNVFNIIQKAQQHTYLICTKRPEKMAELAYKELYRSDCKWLNVFLGTTVENQEMADKRIPELLKCRPFKLFLSVEPMLEKIQIVHVNNFHHLKDGIKYVIAGCESGHGARETQWAWIDDLKDQCVKAGVPLWIKQMKQDGKMVYNHFFSTIKREDLWK